MTTPDDGTQGAGRSLRPDPELMGAYWDALVRPGDTHEVRIPKTRRGPARLFGTTAGYFTDRAAVVRAVSPVTGLDAPAVYVTLNPVDPELRARADNRLVTGIAATTSDDYIPRRRNLLIDIDPTRASEISATDAERDVALTVRDAVSAYLADRDWTDPIASAMTGNGGGLLYRIDVPNDDESTALVVACLAALGELFDTPAVGIDQTVYNPARITKLLGTVAAKGDDCPDLGRVWRLATGTLRPDAGVVSREQLEDLAQLRSAAEDAAPRREGVTLGQVRDGGTRAWTVAEVLARNGIGWREERRRYGVAYSLDRCLTSSDHNDGAAIIELASGALDYRCHHNSCRGKGWSDARAALGLPAPGASAGARSSDEAAAEPWPEPADLEAIPRAPTLPLALLPAEIAAVTEDVADRLQCPPDYVAWTLLVAIAGLIGRGAGIRPKRYDDWTERPCLWVANIGPPSWMKSPALAEGFRPLARQAARDHEAYLAEHLAWELECAEIRAGAKNG